MTVSTGLENKTTSNSPSSDKLGIVSIVYIVAEVTIGFVCIVVNSVALKGLYSKNRSCNISNSLILNVFISDISVGLLAALGSALVSTGMPYLYYNCVAVVFFILGSTNVSVLTRLAFFLEKVLALTIPSACEGLQRESLGIFVNLFIWCAGFLCASIPIHWVNRGSPKVESCSLRAVTQYEYLVYFNIFVLILLPLAVVVSLYLYFLYLVHRYARRIRTSYEMFILDKSMQDTFAKDIRFVMMMPGVLIVLFVVTWLPISIMYCVDIFCLNCTHNEFFLFATVLSHFNSCLYPLLYTATRGYVQTKLRLLFMSPLHHEELYAYVKDALKLKEKAKKLSDQIEHCKMMSSHVTEIIVEYKETYFKSKVNFVESPEQIVENTDTQVESKMNPAE
ncbi:somatostatin receptor type 3 [Biomphalaria pfeifferi]|uniref:Somatostatin receptor type 3 n=1 Tax=Biomphalaria pfeifferi TaxID=112525 RepID=A0AAD8BAM3_BIOPF|nr:somatostatin receptor type 3 [Biomphalaria pfeifferi]